MEQPVETWTRHLRWDGAGRMVVVWGEGTWRATDLWPYGGIHRQTTSGGAPPLLAGEHVFTGHEREAAGEAADPLEGLDYMHARYYFFNFGRFLSVDPVGGTVGSSQSWNRYAYVRGNPVNAVDPDGKLDIKAVYDRGVGVALGTAQHPYIYQITFDSKLQRVGELVGKRAAKKIIGKPYSYLIPAAEKAHKLVTGATVRVHGEDTGVDAVSGFFDAPAFEGMVRKKFEEIVGKSGDGVYTEKQLEKLQGAINEVVDSLDVSASDKEKILGAYNVGRIVRVARQVSETPETEK